SGKPPRFMWLSVSIDGSFDHVASFYSPDVFKSCSSGRSRASLRFQASHENRKQNKSEQQRAAYHEQSSHQRGPQLIFQSPSNRQPPFEHPRLGVGITRFDEIRGPTPILLE